MPLPNLPNELLLRIAWFLLTCARCDCHHFTRNLYSLASTCHQFHALLSHLILSNPETRALLLWGITHNRHDTITLALSRGADLEDVLLDKQYRNRNTVGIAGFQHSNATNAIEHDATFATVAFLLQAGAKPKFQAVSHAACRGDLDLVKLYLPHFSDINERHPLTGATLLDIVASRNQVECMKVLLGAGADPNSCGDPSNTAHSRHFPALGRLGRASVRVFQTLIDSGADATWEDPSGRSIIENLIRRYPSLPENHASIILLAQHGSRLPPGHQPFNLSSPLETAIPSRPRRMRDHRRWINVVGGDRRAVARTVMIPVELGCGCPDCPLEETGITRTVRASDRR